MFKGLEQLAYEEQLRELGVFIPKRRNREGTINVCKHLKGDCKKDSSRLFSAVFSDRTREKGHKPKHGLNTRTGFLTVRMTEHKHRLPREIVISLLGRIQKPSRHSPRPLAVGGPA